METIKIGIIEPDNFSLRAVNKLREVSIVELFDGKDLKSFISDKYAIFVRLKYKIDDSLLETASNLKYICSPTTGLNHISMSKRIQIVSLKGEHEFLSSIRATPEHIIGLCLSLLRNYKTAFLNEKNRVWDRDKYRGYELYNNSIGIIGMGRIGKIIAKYFNSFDSKVYYFDTNEHLPNQEYADKLNTVEELIEKSRIIILCADYRDENRLFFNKHYFSMMKRKYFINASRGELIDEIDFLDFIKNGEYLGIGIDVLSNETSREFLLDDFITAAEGRNVIITPHIGGATYTSMERTEEFVVNKLVSLMNTKSMKQW